MRTSRRGGCLRWLRRGPTGPATSGRTATAVLRPASLDEVADAVRDAAADGRPGQGGRQRALVHRHRGRPSDRRMDLSALAGARPASTAAAGWSPCPPG